MDNEQKYPSIVEQGKNLAKFSLDLINYFQNNDNGENKALLVSDNTYNKRLKTCNECDKFDSSQNRCYECGCSIPIKAKFVLDSCPLNKWTFDDAEWEEIFNNILTDMDKSNDDK